MSADMLETWGSLLKVEQEESEQLAPGKTNVSDDGLNGSSHQVHASVASSECLETDDRCEIQEVVLSARCKTLVLRCLSSGSTSTENTSA